MRVDLVPGDHLVRDARQRDDVGRDRGRRLIEGLENAAKKL
jgi:hypothetical protein